jgi:hypothetical protein
MPVEKSDKVACKTPTPGKQPTRIDRWKYDAVREAILKVIPNRGEGVLFSDLSDKVKAVLPARQLADLGSVTWYTTTVKLDLEVRGEIYRVEAARPQRLRRN